jgi:hypothetical protein
VAGLDGEVTLLYQISCAVTKNVSKLSKCSDSAAELSPSSPGCTAAADSYAFHINSTVGKDAGTITGLTPSSQLSTVTTAVTVSAMVELAIRWLSLRLLLATTIAEVAAVLTKWIDHRLSAAKH